MKKLYKLSTAGLGDFWVIEEDPTKAEESLKKILDSGDGYGFSSKRTVTGWVLFSAAIERDDRPTMPYFITDENRLVL
jgi:hypothetical protein